jgi:hypothetical protein
MKQFLAMLVCVSVIVTTGGCSTVKKVGAGVALPFAAIGDTIAVLPFQGADAASKKLIELGDDHVQKVREENEGKVTLSVAEDTAMVYYIPGYGLRPIGAFASPRLYPMTRSCLAVFGPEKEELPEEEIPEPARKKKKVREEFEEW